MFFCIIREKINEHFVATKHNVDPSSVDLLERDGDIIHGDNTEYDELRDFVVDNELVEVVVRL